MQAPTSDQIRNDIGTGATGEKVAMPDPAAAPWALTRKRLAPRLPPSSAPLRGTRRRSVPRAPVVTLPGGAIYLALVLLLAAIIVDHLSRAALPGYSS